MLLPGDSLLTGMVKLAALLLLLAGGCSTPESSVRKQAYNTAAFESELKRGISTRADVEHIFGKPNGSGSLWFPTVATAEDTWLYQKVRMKASGETFEVQMDIVLIFFKEDKMDGFMWFSDANNTWHAEPVKDGR